MGSPAVTKSTEELAQPPLSFFARVKAELKKLFSHIPGWEASAAATITYTAPLVEALLALTEPAAAPAATLLLEKIQSAMAAAAVVVKDAGPTPTLLTYLNAINQDLQQVLSAAHIQDASTAAKITALVSTITGEVSAMMEAVGAAQA